MSSFYHDIIHQQEILAIYVKAEIEINNNAMIADLVGNVGCRGDFECGRNSVLGCFIL